MSGRIQYLCRPWRSPEGVDYVPGFVDREVYPEIPEECFWMTVASVTNAQAIAMEREACARIAESFIDGELYQGARLRDAIRARGAR